jgi:hypothetical protein
MVNELAQCLRNNTEAQQYIVESLKRELEMPSGIQLLMIALLEF